MYDKDGDGFISADEFEIILETAKIHDPVRMGNISFEEFVNEG